MRVPLREFATSNDGFTLPPFASWGWGRLMIPRAMGFLHNCQHEPKIAATLSVLCQLQGRIKVCLVRHGEASFRERIRAEWLNGTRLGG